MISTSISRRGLLLFSCSVAALALTSCTQLEQVGQASSQVAQDAKLIADGVQAILPDLKTVTSTGAAIAGQIQTLASQIAVATPASLPTLATALASAVKALTGYQLPGWASTVISAAQALMPVILMAAGVALAGPFQGIMRPDQARLVLAAARAK